MNYITKAELKSQIESILSTDKDRLSSIKEITNLIKDKEPIVINDEDYYFTGFDLDFEKNELIIILETELESENKECLEFSLL